MSAQQGRAEPRHRLPEQGPHAGAAEDLRLWQELAKASRSTVAESAGKWRTGLAGLFAALTGLLFLKGEAIGVIEAPWRPWVIGLVLVAAVCVLSALWSALTAEAPPIATLDYRQVIARHGSVAAYQGSVAEEGARRLYYARQWAVIGLVLFLAGTAMWWVAPRKAPAPSLISVTFIHEQATKSVCGKLIGTHAGEAQFTVTGQDQPVAVPLDEIRNIGPTASCPG